MSTPEPITPSAAVAAPAEPANVYRHAGFVSFLIAQGVIVAADLEAFEAIEPSEELAVRLEADRVEAEKKAAEAKAKAAAKGGEAPATAGEETKEEVAEDLF